jgi:biotin transport system substrate-specific component
LIDFKEILNISGQLFLAVGLMWISSLISFDFNGIVLPISLQSMTAILLPLIFRGNIGVIAVALYLVLGALGVHMFAGGLGGWKYIQSTSGGYLIGFLIVAFLTSLVKNWIKGKNGFIISFLIFIAMHAVLTASGLSWLHINSIDVSFSVHVSPFMPGTVIKSIIGATIAEVVRFYYLKKTTDSLS